MLSTKDQHDAERIATWNETHGATFGRVNQAHDALAAAISRYETDPSPSTLADLRATGMHLADVTGLELNTPGCGVPEYDGPRREAVDLWRKAGELVGEWDPSDDADDRGGAAAALLVEGTGRNAETNAFAKALLARVRRHFGQ